MHLVLHGTVAEIVQNQVDTGNYQSPEDLVYEALQALAKKKVNEGINRGLEDIEAEKYIEINSDNISDIADSIIAKSLQ